MLYNITQIPSRTRRVLGNEKRSCPEHRRKVIGDIECPLEPAHRNRKCNSLATMG